MCLSATITGGIKVGVDCQVLKLLLTAKRRGVSFARVATIGRQSLGVSPSTIAQLLGWFGYTVADGEITALIDGGYAEGLLRFLGARESESVDYSPYEGATIIQDMNVPI